MKKFLRVNPFMRSPLATNSIKILVIQLNEPQQPQAATKVRSSTAAVGCWMLVVAKAKTAKTSEPRRPQRQQQLVIVSASKLATSKTRGSANPGLPPPHTFEVDFCRATNAAACARSLSALVS